MWKVWEGVDVQSALKKVLGPDKCQQGSLVDVDKLRCGKVWERMWELDIDNSRTRGAGGMHGAGLSGREEERRRQPLASHLLPAGLTLTIRRALQAHCHTTFTPCHTYTHVRCRFKFNQPSPMLPTAQLLSFYLHHVSTLSPHPIAGLTSTCPAP